MFFSNFCHFSFAEIIVDATNSVALRTLRIIFRPLKTINVFKSKF